MAVISIKSSQGYTLLSEADGILWWSKTYGNHYSEVWVVEVSPYNLSSFRNYHGKYLTASKTGIFSATSETVAEAESFEVIYSPQGICIKSIYGFYLSCTAGIFQIAFLSFFSQYLISYV